MSQELIDGLDLEGELTYLYESQVHLMLRYFHLQKLVHRDGYVKQPIVVKKKTTTCKYEYIVKNTNMITVPDKEIGVPYKYVV